MLAPQQLESVYLRPANVASRRFSRSMHGYDPDEVHQFLEDVADYLSRLEGELEWRRARRARQPGTIGEQQEAIRVVTAAREQAERILADERKEADGYVRLARAIADQLALESQARSSNVALAITRASGSSTTVEGQDFDDMEDWIDASVFDVTKSREPETPQAVEAANDDAKVEDVATTPDAPSASGGVAVLEEALDTAAVHTLDEAARPATKGKKKSKKRPKKKS